MRHSPARATHYGRSHPIVIRNALLQEAIRVDMTTLAGAVA